MLPKGNTNYDFNTRRRRRAAVSKTVSLLSAVRDAERRALDNTHENFRGTESFETGEFAVDALDDAIETLKDVY